jgi:serine/threonine protein phosphatase PrpC
MRNLGYAHAMAGLEEQKIVAPPGTEPVAVLAGSWLHAESLVEPAGNRRESRDAAGEFHDGEDRHLLVVADAGDHAAGARASRLCVQTLGDVFGACDLSPGERLRRGLLRADERLRAGEAGSSAGAVAVCALALTFAPEPRAWLAGAGSCRIYRLRAGALAPLATRISPIGEGPRPSLEVAEIDLEPGDRFLLCSDGVADVVPEADLPAALRLSAPGAAAYRLAARARRHGAPDDACALVAIIHEPLGHPGAFRQQGPERETVAPWSAARPEPELDVAIDFDEDEEIPAPGPRPRGIGRGVRLLLIGTAAIMGSAGGFVGGILLSEAFR